MLKAALKLYSQIFFFYFGLTSWFCNFWVWLLGLRGERGQICLLCQIREATWAKRYLWIQTSVQIEIEWFLFHKNFHKYLILWQYFLLLFFSLSCSSKHRVKEHWLVVQISAHKRCDLPFITEICTAALGQLLQSLLKYWLTGFMLLFLASQSYPWF